MPRRIYTDAASLIQYAASRGVSVDEDTAAQAIEKAQDYLDGMYDYNGKAVEMTSAFPRSGLALFDDDVIPTPVVQATLKVALMIIEDVPLTEGAVGMAQIRKEVVATNRVETEYATNYRDSNVQSAAVPISSITRSFREYELIDSYGTGVNLLGVRG